MCLLKGIGASNEASLHVFSTCSTCVCIFPVVSELVRLTIESPIVLLMSVIEYTNKTSDTSQLLSSPVSKSQFSNHSVNYRFHIIRRAGTCSFSNSELSSFLSTTTFFTILQRRYFGSQFTYTNIYARL